MRSPVVYSTTGSILSSEEISFAHHVAASFSMQTKPDYVRTVKRTDPVTGAIVLYSTVSNIAYVTPGGVTDYVGMLLPNPTSYRGVSIGVVDLGALGGLKTRVYASDGSILAEVSMGPSGGGSFYPGSPLAEGWQSATDKSPWNGSGDIWMFADAGETFSVLSFVVPDDCIYPEPIPNIYPNWLYVHENGVSVLGTPSLETVFPAHIEAGIAAFQDRRKRWLKANSDSFLESLKITGYLPSAWELAVKRDVDKAYDVYPPAYTIGYKTSRSPTYSVSFRDTVISDTSELLTQEGVMVTNRTATLQYPSVVNGVPTTKELVVVGSLTQTVTRHNDQLGAQIGLSRLDVYIDWFNRDSSVLPEGVASSLSSPFIEDKTGAYIGAFLNGIVQLGYNTDSTLGLPGDPLDYSSYTPPYPAARSSVTLDVPKFVKDWHDETKLIYDASGATADTLLNDSALHGVTEVRLTPVGLIADGAGVAAAGEAVGIFPNTTGPVEDGTRVEIYGTAVYGFDWAVGALTFKRWEPLTANGVEVVSKAVDLPTEKKWSDSPLNCVVTYKNLHWPDVVSAIGDRDKDMESGTFAYSDPVLYELIKAVKAG